MDARLPTSPIVAPPARMPTSAPIASHQGARSPSIIARAVRRVASDTQRELGGR